MLKIGPARFRAPEVLFRPDLLGEECEGMHEVLLLSIQKSDLDLRKILFQNIVLSGGSTLFKVHIISYIVECPPCKLSYASKLKKIPSFMNRVLEIVSWGS